MNFLRILVFIISFSSILDAQVTEHAFIAPSNTPAYRLICTNIESWNNKKIVTGASKYNLNCGFIQLDTTIYGNFNQTDFVFDYQVRTTSSCALGNDLFAVSGTLFDSIAGLYPRPFILVVNPSFASQMSFSIEDTSQSFQITPLLAITPDSGFVVCWTGGNGECRLLRFNHSGNLIWGKMISISGIFHTDDLVVNASGHILIAGRDQSLQGSQPAIIKLDTSGQVINAFIIDEPQAEKVSFALSENNIVIAFCSPDPQTSNNKLNLILMNQADSIILSYAYSSQGIFMCSDVTMYNDTTWLITGGVDLMPFYLQLGLLIKGSEHIPDDEISCIQSPGSNTVFISTILDSIDRVWALAEQSVPSVPSALVYTSMPIQNCNTASIFSIVSNYMPSIQSSFPNVFAYSPNIQNVNNYTITDNADLSPFCPNDVEGELLQIPSIYVFPNPVVTNATFQFTGFDENKTLFIFDQFGKEIWRKVTFENQIEFPSENFASGLYYYQVLSTTGKIATGKLVIE